MGYVVSFILFVLEHISYKNDKAWYSPNCFFCLLWALISLLAQMRLFGLFAVEFRTWCIILFGSLSFYSGAMLAKKYKIKLFNNAFSNNNFEQKPFLTKRLFHILMLIYILLESSSLFRVIPLLLSGVSLGDIRAASFGYGNVDVVSNFNLNGGIFTYIGIFKEYLSIVLLAYGIYLFLSKKKMKYLIMVIIPVVISSITTGGRYILINLALDLVVCLGILKKGTGIKETVKKSFSSKKIWYLLVIVFCSVVYITIKRGTEITGVFEMFYVYLCGGVKLLDLHVNRIQSSGVIGFPFSGLYGFWSLILPILKNLDIPNPYGYTMVQQYVMKGQAWLQIGENLYSNAFLSTFYYLYADLRWIGLLVGMGFLGFLSGRFYRKVCTNMNDTNIVMYLIIVQMLFKTIQQFPFTSEPYVLVFCIYLFRKLKFKRS